EDLYYRLSTVPIYVPPLRDRGSDVELLFRKFATDFAEKYRVKPISLTDDAKEILLQYRFPGNIRQLKNIVEQISVLSTENKEITGDILQHYLPRETSLPALYHNHVGEKEGLSERDILYKVLFDMKRDMVELKKLVLTMYNNQGMAGQLVKDHPDLFDGIETEPKGDAVLLNVAREAQPVEEVQDIIHEMED